MLQLGKLYLTFPAGKFMLAAVAEMEHELIVERTQAGLARAKAQSKTLGRPSKTLTEQRVAICKAYEAEQSVSALARQYQISRATVLSIVEKR